MYIQHLGFSIMSQHVAVHRGVNMGNNCHLAWKLCRAGIRLLFIHNLHTEHIWP